MILMIALIIQFFGPLITARHKPFSVIIVFLRESLALVLSNLPRNNRDEFSSWSNYIEFE